MIWTSIPLSLRSVYSETGLPCTVFSKALSGIGIASPCRCPPCPHPAQMPSKPSNITVRSNLFFIVSPNFGNGSSGLSAFRRTKTAPICKNKKLLRKNNRPGRRIAPCRRQIRRERPSVRPFATPLARKTHVFPATAARSSGKPQHPGRMPGPTRPKPPPVKAALLGIPKNVIFARVIL